MTASNTLPTGFTLGCDPEVFVIDNKTGKFVSAAGLIPGDKDTPFKVSGTVVIGKGQMDEKSGKSIEREVAYSGAVQVDGMALEFNIDPVTDFDSFDGNILGVMHEMDRLLKQSGDYSIACVPSVIFDAEYYASLPEDSKVLGCNPDNNAWLNGEENPAPNGDDGSRGGAGHIHFGWGQDIPVDHPEHMQVCCDFVKHLDNYIGLFSKAIDGDNVRRRTYGKAGAFRPKSYGVEYRTPSNQWLLNRPRRRFVFNTAKKAIEDMMSGKFNSVDIQDIINSDDYSGKDGKAEQILKSNGVHVPTSVY